MDNITKDKLFEVGDKFIGKDNLGKEKICHIIDVNFKDFGGSLSGWYYTYNYGPEDTEQVGMLNNLVVSVYDLKKL